MEQGAPNSLAEVIELGAETILGTKWTASPAEVISYDTVTKRVKARITPIRAGDDGIPIEYPILNNVPVQWLGGGGFTVTAPLAAGDQVLLVFCGRGISNFKKAFDAGSIQSGGVMQIDSAVAIPCFGSLNITPSAGLSLQKEDGSVKVEVLENSVKSSTSGGTLELKASGEVAHGSGAKITAAGDFVTALGTSLDGHVHTQANDGGGDTQSPVNPVVAP